MNEAISQIDVERIQDVNDRIIMEILGLNYAQVSAQTHQCDE